MKVRTGFVSNSSSSSFVCEVCGAVEGGWDLYLSEIDWVECEKYHVICDSCSADVLAKMSDDRRKSLDETDELPVEICPVCTLQKINSDILLRYMLKILGSKREEVRERAQRRFGSLEKLKAWLDDPATGGVNNED